MARVVFIQGLAAWISFCLMLTIIWHRQVQQTSPAHEFGAPQHMNGENTEGGHGLHALKPPPKRLSEKPPSALHQLKQDIRLNNPPRLVKTPEPLLPISYHPGPPPEELSPSPNKVIEQSNDNSGKALSSPRSSPQSLPLDISNVGSRVHPTVEWLPDLKLSETVNEKPISVYMDWGRGNLAFAFANYRSLESVLAHHPNAKVLIQTVAPSSASMYRYANTLSWTQFKKYLKRGYEVNIEIMSHLTNVYAVARDRFDRPKENIASRAYDMATGNPRPGQGYWSEIKDKCCHPPEGFNDQRKVEDSRLVPGHLNFLRLLRLYASGGVYLGFSFLLSRPFDLNERIVDLGPEWWVDPEENESVPDAPLGGDPPACGNEFMLQFPPRDSLLHCALEDYGNHFNEKGEPKVDGPCGQNGAKISETYEHPSIGLLRRLHNRPVDEPKKKLSAAASWYVGYDGVDLEYEAAGVRAEACLRVLFRSCLKKEEKRVDKQGEKLSIPLKKQVIEWGQCDMSKLHERYHGEDHPHQHIFTAGVADLEKDADLMVGSASEEGLSPPTNTKSASLAESFLDAKQQTNDGHISSRLSSSASKSLSIEAGHHANNGYLGFWIGPPALDGVWKEPAAGTNLDIRFAHVHGGLTKWGKMQEVGEACLRARNCSSFDATGTLAESPVDLQAAKFRCAPQFIIPGTQKGASTFLFHALSRHPQVIPPLRGAHGYKEAGAYVLQNCRRKPNQIGNRVHRFPYIEQDEPFVSGDGTVHYMVTCPAIPGEILRDNNKVRVIFALREPISRMWSDYRFAAQWYKSKNLGFNEVVAGTLPHYQNCYNQYVNGSRAKEISERPPHQVFSKKEITAKFGSFEYFVPYKQAIDTLGISDKVKTKQGEHEQQALDEGSAAFYTLGCKTAAQDNHNLIKKSLFLFQVRHWLSILGSDKMMVVTTEEVIKDQKMVLAEVLKFIGLCDYKFGNLGKDNVTPFDVRGNFRINEESFKMLKDFFKPYNEVLYSLIGRDFGWNSKTFDSFRK